MRRGHPSRGGWRGETPRHFRPRMGGPPGYRPPRGYPPAQLDPPRFPPPHRYHYRGPPPFTASPGPVQQDDHPRSGYNDHTWFRGQRDQDNNSTRSKRHDNPHESYEKGHVYFDTTNRNDRYYINNMGDVDQRQPFPRQTRHESYPQRDISPWPGRSHKMYERREETPLEGSTNTIPQNDYSGHRPPASDHYEAKSANNPDTFSRSVDDTVNIIRRKLQTRNDPQIQSTQNIENHDNNGSLREPPVDTFQTHNLQQEQSQRKHQRQRPNVKTKCDKMKNNIVHQLFKMDKDRIQRLMDNPNSSHKFEYAINSLITESQNSFNRHMRSAAEKSLCGSRNEIMEYNESDTIYEDTFMKQMQCILEPQDTVLLEDIKPLVMAELNKVLQLSEFEQRHSISDDVDNSTRDYHNLDNYLEQPYESYSGEYTADCQDNSQYYVEAQSYKPPDSNDYDKHHNIRDHDSKSVLNESEHSQEYDSGKLFHRRSSRKSSDEHKRKRSRSSEKRRRSRSTSENALFGSPVPVSNDKTKPLFDVNPEQLSEDEDPFAELDKQYHVAVDHNFIEAEDPTLPEYVNTSTTAPSGDVDYRDNSSVCKTPIKKEFPQDLRLPDVIDNSIIHAIECNIKAELLENGADLSSHQMKTDDHNVINKEKIQEPKERDDSSKSDLSNSSLNKSSIRSNSRKRSVDQQPSHRKEKRKKSESSCGETNKQILNKNIIINLNDCAKKAENCDSSGKSIFNLYFSKGQTEVEALKEKKNEGSDSGYSEKYVKRKESPSKPVKEKNCENKKNNSSSSSHSTSTSKDNKCVTPTKSDSKLKLQTFDMFESQPRKSSSVHQLHRNSGNPVPANSIAKSTSQDDKVKTLPLKSISKQVTRKHASTQVIRKVHSKECQTVATRLAVRGVQTNPVIIDRYYIERHVNKSTNVYDRMKEIDMEIQILLKEKFQLYHSMENKNAGDRDFMHSFGMTVLNFEKNNDIDPDPGEMNVDNIVNDFTNIPQEELEQIALESIEHEQEVPTQKVEKNTRRQKIQKQEKAHPSRLSSKRRKKPKSPNISLLEQIITDERPLEEIISLDAFETSPVQTRNNKKKRFKKMLTKTVKMQPETETVLPQCYVRLIREDFSHYFKPNLSEYDIATPEIEIPESVPVLCSSTEVVVEPTISDFHFQDDMLDVSEDIVIDSNCEVKLDVKELVADSVIEEVVLDNSQTCEEQASTATADAPQGNTCKMYDYSADEDLRQDSFCITGNGDAVLAIECIENNFLAACLDGNVYHFNTDGQLLTTLRGSNLAVTCLTIVNEKYGTTVYTGSLDSRIRYYDLETGLEKGPECNVLSPIQTMDRAWDTVFVGTRTGFVLQFECKNNMLIPVSTIKFSDQAILALRALKEGPRKVLLVAARSENVTIKDAQTGLLLRTLCGPKMTVYTLLYEDGKIYCGTSSNQIQVFDYASGTHIGKHDGGKGAVCLRSAGGVLFAGCYDGCVYAFRAGETEPFAQLRGPGVMLLSLAVVGSKIIAGYKDRSLYIWKIPISIMQEMVL